MRGEIERYGCDAARKGDAEVRSVLREGDGPGVQIERASDDVSDTERNTILGKLVARRLISRCAEAVAALARSQIQ